MSDTHRLVEIVCDGDRHPNLTRKYTTVEDCEWAHAQKVAAMTQEKLIAGHLQALEDVLKFLKGGEQSQ